MSPNHGIAITATGVRFRYDGRIACDGIDFEVPVGEVHAFLGPNGSGKSTLFKILSTAYPMQEGEIKVFGFDLRREMTKIRPCLGIVFQSPALDKKLTVRENLIYGGHLFGLRGPELTQRVDAMLDRTGLADRSRELVKSLSGGLRRRVELAKGLLPRPQVLILDEPSTGLDPGARADLWRFVRTLHDVTVLFTTHLLDEASAADHVVILNQGKVLAAGRPEELMRRIGGHVLEIRCEDPKAMAAQIEQRLGVSGRALENAVRIERSDAHRLVPQLVEAFGPGIERLTLSSPSLEDVYIRETGHRFWGDEQPAAPAPAKEAR